jgi:formylglycine-generating enzyme required for sulfatase activity
VLAPGGMLAANPLDETAVVPTTPEAVTAAAVTRQATAGETTPGQPPPGAAPARLTPWLWPALIIALIFLLVSGFFWFGGRDPGEAVAPVTATAPPATTPATAEPTSADTHTAVPTLPGMAFIPAGSFTQGNNDGNSDEAPARRVSLDAFYMDLTEVTNAAYAEFVAAADHTAPDHWRRPSPAIWNLQASEAYAVGSPDNHYDYRGEMIRPGNGVMTITVDAEANEGTLIALFEGTIETESGRELTGLFRIEQTEFIGASNPRREGGIGEHVLMHGLSGNETPLYPELLSYLATWGLADVYLDDELLYEGLGIHVMFSDGVRDDEAHFVRRSDGRCCFSERSPGDSWLDPDEVEISVWLFPGTAYGATRGVWIDLYYNQVTIISAPDYIGPPTFAANEERHPVTHVTWADAAAYCDWRGRRLPTEAEWEYAARGDNAAFRYPWGERPGELINAHDRFAGPTPVGNFPRAASPFGLHDMAGNVWEWTADWYEADYYSRAPAENPPGPAQGSERVARGGGFRLVDFLGLDETRVSHRRPLDPNTAADDVGFRCAISLVDAASGE